MMTPKEYRSYEFDIRAGEEEKHGHVLEGMPIVFEQETNISGLFRERIDKGALDKTDLRDVRFLVGHNFSSIPLARSRNNNENSTMQMTVTDEGMRIRVDLDTENNAEAKTLYSAAERGDISGMSFAFIVDEDSWEDLDSDLPLRHIRSIRQVLEVSAVTFPAYEGTSLVAARSEGTALESAISSLESARAKAAEERAAKAKAESRAAALERLHKYRKKEVIDNE